MATAEDGVLDFSVASVVEDVLQQQGNRLSDVDLASRKAEEACMIITFLTILMIFFVLYFASFFFLIKFKIFFFLF